MGLAGRRSAVRPWLARLAGRIGGCFHLAGTQIACRLPKSPRPRKSVSTCRSALGHWLVLILGFGIAPVALSPSDRLSNGVGRLSNDRGRYGHDLAWIDSR